MAICKIYVMPIKLIFTSLVLLVVVLLLLLQHVLLLLLLLLQLLLIKNSICCFSDHIYIYIFFILETEICKEMETSLNSNPKQFIGALKDAR